MFGADLRVRGADMCVCDAEVFVCVVLTLSTDEITIQKDFVSKLIFPCDILYLCCVNSVIMIIEGVLHDTSRYHTVKTVNR